MSMLQSMMATPTGAIAFYLGTGVLVLIAGWIADTALGMGNNNS